CWKESLRWLGLRSTIGLSGRRDRALTLLQRLGVGWKGCQREIRSHLVFHCLISSTWKVRNGMIFKSDGLNWEKLVEEYKVLS
ncbi:hypothetical protein A2U01_0069026, partial [Trifolium medium]|nr:hypothetical protein [Trifolium medium]